MPLSFSGVEKQGRLLIEAVYERLFLKLRECNKWVFTTLIVAGVKLCG
jgi:hypothetical protein